MVYPTVTTWIFLIMRLIGNKSSCNISFFLQQISFGKMLSIVGNLEELHLINSVSVYVIGSTEIMRMMDFSNFTLAQRLRAWLPARCHSDKVIECVFN